MARKKFNVTAVDNSRVAINQIKEKASEKKLNNIEAICKNITKYKMFIFFLLSKLKNKNDTSHLLANTDPTIPNYYLKT